MTKPYLIILDEPCAGMDPGAREKFLASLRRIGRQKKMPALIYVTHHIEEILPLFGKTLVLGQGRVLYAGRTKQVLKPHVLDELYGASFSLISRKGRHWPVVE
jgi:iron complex transport system ATP-binding protein